MKFGESELNCGINQRRLMNMSLTNKVIKELCSNDLSKELNSNNIPSLCKENKLTENEKAIMMIKMEKSKSRDFKRSRRTRIERKNNKLETLLTEYKELENSKLTRDCTLLETRNSSYQKVDREEINKKHLVRRHLNELYSKIIVKAKINKTNGRLNMKASQSKPLKKTTFIF